ncbi:hypothetical protein ABK040_001235 [Willaertia magna]
MNTIFSCVLIVLCLAVVGVSARAYEVTPGMRGMIGVKRLSDRAYEIFSDGEFLDELADRLADILTDRAYEVTPGMRGMIGVKRMADRAYEVTPGMRGMIGVKRLSDRAYEVTPGMRGVKKY